MLFISYQKHTITPNDLSVFINKKINVENGNQKQPFEFIYDEAGER